MLSTQPSVGDRFNLANGESIEVIGFGTNGIIVEYHDGRAELIEKPDWPHLLQRTELSPRNN